ncbi:MAG: copper chaperone PCu(A)C [Massilia sp.]
MKKMMLFAVLATACALASARADLSVTAPWVRATVPAQTNTGAFMRLQSASGTRLVGVSSPVAASVQLHQMAMQGEMMQMREVDGIDLPAGQGVNLASGSYHIMLIGLKHQLKAGETVDMTLQLQAKGKKRESVTVTLPVKPLGFVVPTVPGPVPH